MSTTEPMSLEERREILEKEIRKYVKRGYQVASRTDTTAQLIKPKKFSLFWFCVGLIILYLAYYMWKRDKTVYLEVDKLGRIKRT